MRYKTQVWKPFQKDSYRWAWHDKRVIGILQEFGRDIRRCHERIWRGYCDYDLFSISDWYLGVRPTMLEDFKDHMHGYPADFDPHPFDKVHGSVGNEIADDAAEGMKSWSDVLERMIFLLKEADEDSCSRKNPYQDEYEQAQEEFDRKYGLWGEKLMTGKEKENDRQGKGKQVYMLGDVPEYEAIDKKYMDEEKSIYEYRVACKDEAFSLFSKWFYNLWD